MPISCNMRVKAKKREETTASHDANSCSALKGKKKERRKRKEKQGSKKRGVTLEAKKRVEENNNKNKNETRTILPAQDNPERRPSCHTVRAVRGKRRGKYASVRRGSRNDQRGCVPP